jgi:hypothetical protein
MLHLISNISEIPLGTEYRVIGQDCPWWSGKSLIETQETIKGLEIAPDKYPNGVPTDPKGCIADWKLHKPEKTEEEIVAEVSEAVAKVKEIAVKYPTKVSADLKAAISKETVSVAPVMEEKP